MDIKNNIFIKSTAIKIYYITLKIILLKNPSLVWTLKKLFKKSNVSMDLKK